MANSDCRLLKLWVRVRFNLGLSREKGRRRGLGCEWVAGVCLHLSYSPTDVNFALDVYVVEGLLAEPLFSQRTGAPGNGAGGGTLGENAVYA